MDNNFCHVKSYTIKEMPLSERPREKLYDYGVASLSNAELLTILIRTGSSDESALDLANKVLRLDESGFSYLSKVSLEELTKIRGIGKCKAAQILAAVEMAKRLNQWGSHDKIKVDSPLVLVNLVMDKMKYLEQEHFNIALLDTKNQILSIDNISIGTLNASIVHPRDVFKLAIKKNANSMILIHNHPSGDPSPSNEDIRVTERLAEVGEITGIKVLDHIIIGDNRYTSFREKNII